MKFISFFWKLKAAVGVLLPAIKGDGVTGSVGWSSLPLYYTYLTIMTIFIFTFLTSGEKLEVMRQPQF